MDEVFAIIGKLYFDLARAQSAIEVLKQQIQKLEQESEAHKETP